MKSFILHQCVLFSKGSKSDAIFAYGTKSHTFFRTRGCGFYEALQKFQVWYVTRIFECLLRSHVWVADIFCQQTIFLTFIRTFVCFISVFIHKGTNTQMAKKNLIEILDMERYFKLVWLFIGPKRFVY